MQQEKNKKRNRKDIVVKISGKNRVNNLLGHSIAGNDK
jgi:hypothetical protein